MGREKGRLTVDHKELVLVQGIDPLYSSVVDEEIEREKRRWKKKGVNKGRDERERSPACMGIVLNWREWKRERKRETVG